MSLKSRFLRWQDILLCAVRKWWRPIGCMAAVGGLLVNVVVIPLQTDKPADLEKAAPYLAALVAAFGVRAFEKIKSGAAD